MALSVCGRERAREGLGVHIRVHECLHVCARVQMPACVCGAGPAGGGRTRRREAALPEWEFHRVPGLSGCARNSGVRAGSEKVSRSRQLLKG